jgi:putative transcriptional regulator
MKTAFNKLMQGLDEVESYLKGDAKGFKAHVPGEVDVKSIRRRLGLTQARFSDTFGFSLDAVKNWETQRRTPEAAARVLLTVIKNDPAAVIVALYPHARKFVGHAPKARVKQIKRFMASNKARAEA